MDYIVFTSVECSLDILGIVVIDSLNVVSNEANLVHEFLAESLVDHQAFLVVAASEALFLVHGVTIEETSSSEPWEIFTVRIRSEDEASG